MSDRPTNPRLFLPLSNPPDEDRFRHLAGESRIRHLVDGYFLDRATLMIRGAAECARLLRHADGRERELPVIVDLGGPQSTAQVPALADALMRIANLLRPEAILLGRGMFRRGDMGMLSERLQVLPPTGQGASSRAHLCAYRPDEPNHDHYRDQVEAGYSVDLNLWPDNLPLPPEGDELERLSQRIRPHVRGDGERVLVLHPAVVAGREFPDIVDTLRACREQIGAKAD